jgi:hypothetical protein
LEPQEEEPLKHLPEDADDGDRAEVARIPSLVNVLAEEIDLGLVPLARRPPLTEALVVEIEQPRDDRRVLCRLEELDVDAVAL